LNLRTMRSKIRAGRTDWSTLMLAAVEPTVRRSFGFRSVAAAATITLATTAGGVAGVVDQNVDVPEPVDHLLATTEATDSSLVKSRSR
jgi:hypothetical protein